MIRIHANGVVRVLDGFTGLPLAASALRCTVDGMPFRPIAKNDGYFIFTNLRPGEHEVTLRALRYASEHLVLAGGREGPADILVTMKPGEGYRFGAKVTWLTLRIESEKGEPLAGKKVWIAARNPLLELKTAQTKAAKGDMDVRLFFNPTARSVSLPMDFLLIDEDRSEVCRVEDLRETEESCFSAPLQADHKRGRSMFPVQRYTADSMGIIRAVFREPLSVEVLGEGEQTPVSFSLNPGENAMKLTLKSN